MSEEELPVCGNKAWGIGCGAPITTIHALYRCANCNVPMHKACIETHFGDREREGRSGPLSLREAVVSAQTDLSSAQSLIASLREELERARTAMQEVESWYQEHKRRGWDDSCFDQAIYAVREAAGEPARRGPEAPHPDDWRGWLDDLIEANSAGALAVSAHIRSLAAERDELRAENERLEEDWRTILNEREKMRRNHEDWMERADKAVEDRDAALKRAETAEFWRNEAAETIAAVIEKNKQAEESRRILESRYSDLESAARKALGEADGSITFRGDWMRRQVSDATLAKLRRILALTPHPQGTDE